MSESTTMTTGPVYGPVTTMNMTADTANETEDSSSGGPMTTGPVYGPITATGPTTGSESSDSGSSDSDSGSSSSDSTGG